MCLFDNTYYKITTTNYISKTSLCITFRMYSSGPWPLKILMFALLVTREITTWLETTNIPQMPFEQEIDDDIDIKILGVPPQGQAFLDSNTCTEGGGGGLFISARVFFLYDAIHGWMTGRMDEWMKKTSLKTTTTSFTICNVILCWRCLPRQGYCV